MSSFVYYVFLLTFVSVALCQECRKEYHDMNSTVRELEEYCNDTHKPCIVKCCGANDQMFYNFIDTEPHEFVCNSTELYKVNIDKLNVKVTVYKNDIKTKIEKTSKDMNDFILLLDMDKDCKDIYTEYGEMNVYLIENGALMFERPNFYHRWFEKAQYSFCFDYVIDIENGTVIGEPYIGFGIFPKDEPENEYYSYSDDLDRMLFAAIGLLISCYFMILVLVVYAILPELRTLSGLVLMAGVGTQLGAFLLISFEYIATLLEVEFGFCDIIRYPKYFIFLSSMFWISAQSIDVWKLITSKTPAFLRNDRPRREKILQMCVYGLFAWGTPALMTVGVKVVDEMDLTSMPWFIKPHISLTCFFGDEESLMLYQNVPVIILTGINMVFFVLSVIHIFVTERQLSKLDKRESRKNKEKKNRFWIYVKLSLVMGLSWLLYVVVFYLPPEMTWFVYICDFYNLLSGVAIFLFFVFQKKVFRLLQKKIMSHHSFTQSDDRSSRATGSTKKMLTRNGSTSVYSE